MTREPLVTIVTPTLNMGRFLDATIRSVLDQDYPRIQYIIADGGSSDDTLSIVSRYSSRLQFLSAPDAGQADAINRTFRLAEGEIFTFLNADDLYMPGAVRSAVEAFSALPECGVVYGNADWIDETGEIISPYPVEKYAFEAFPTRCFICQPAAFIRAEVLREVGGLDASLCFAFDYDLWIRIGQKYPFAYITQVLAASRMHLQNKTLGQRPASFMESIKVVRRHFGYVPLEMVYGYCDALLARDDRFFSPPKPSAVARMLSVPVGLAMNWRRPGQMLSEFMRLAGSAPTGLPRPRA